MPTCPGCQQSLSYERLAEHVEHCGAIVGDETPERRSIARLERRVDRLERHARDQRREIDRVVRARLASGARDGEGDGPSLRRE